VGKGTAAAGDPARPDDRRDDEGLRVAVRTERTDPGEDATGGDDAARTVGGKDASGTAASELSAVPTPTASSMRVSSSPSEDTARITTAREMRPGSACPSSSHDSPRRRPCSARNSTSSPGVRAPAGASRQPSGGRRRITVSSRDVSEAVVSIRRRLLGCMPAARARAASEMPRAAARVRIADNSPTMPTEAAYSHLARVGVRAPGADDAVTEVRHMVPRPYHRNLSHHGMAA